MALSVTHHLPRHKKIPPFSIKRGDYIYPGFIDEATGAAGRDLVPFPVSPRLPSRGDPRRGIPRERRVPA